QAGLARRDQRRPAPRAHDVGRRTRGRVLPERRRGRPTPEVLRAGDRRDARRALSHGDVRAHRAGPGLCRARGAPRGGARRAPGCALRERLRDQRDTTAPRGWASVRVPPEPRRPPASRRAAGRLAGVGAARDRRARGGPALHHAGGSTRGDRGRGDVALADPAPLRWGVIGATSWVAVKAVIPASVGSPRARLVAVASQSANAPPNTDGRRTYQSYAALLDDPDVEAVYVPLPNSLHRTWVERAALAGKHVLCEKPLAPMAADAAAMASATAAAGVTLLEAYMTPFHPRAAAIDALVRDGCLGDLRFARAAFTGVLDRPDDHRW